MAKRDKTQEAKPTKPTKSPEAEAPTAAPEAANTAEADVSAAQDEIIVKAGDADSGSGAEGEDKDPEGKDAEGAEDAGAEDEEVDKKYVGDYTAEEWEALTPSQKVEFMKAKAKANAKRSSGKAPGRNKSGQPTIGSVACDAIRDGLTNDEVLTKVFETFPNAKTSIASITWYRNSLKSAGESIPTSREIKAARSAKTKGDAENVKDPVAGATEAELDTSGVSAEDMAEAEAMAESGELSQDELNELLG